MSRFYIYKHPVLARELEKHKDLLPHAEYVRRAVKFLRSASTQDPDEADAFIIPINLIHFQFARPQLDPWTFIRTLPYLDRGKHIIWATGDYGQRQRGRYESFHEGRAYPHLYTWLDERIRLVIFESTPEVAPQDIATVPYVLNPLRTPLWEHLLQKAPTKRDLLYAFCGALSYCPLLPEEHIRGGVFKRLAGYGPNFFVGTATDARALYGRNGTYHALFQRALFTLCPAGFGRWTFRLFEALEYGSIPVLIADDYVLPFADDIPWDDLVLRCREKDVLTIADHIAAIPADEIQRRQRLIAMYKHCFSETGVHAKLAKALGKMKELQLAEPPATFNR